MQDVTVDLQRGTGMEVTLNQCIKEHYFKLGIFAFENPHI
jgi:hypothetical protein